MNIVNEMGKVRCENSIVSLLRVWPSDVVARPEHRMLAVHANRDIGLELPGCWLSMLHANHPPGYNKQ